MKTSLFPKPLALAVLASLSLIDTRLRSASCRTANSESGAGIHETGIVTRFAAAAYPSRYLFVQAGADDDHVALCDAAHLPVGYTDDQPVFAEDAINVQIPGAIKGTRKVIGVAALGEYVDIYAAANGQVQAEPNVAGVYYKVGRTMRASDQSTDGLYLTEAVLHSPTRLVVLAKTAAYADMQTALNTSPGAAIKFLAV